MCSGQLFELTSSFQKINVHRHLSTYLFIPLLITKNWTLYVTEGDVNTCFDGYQHLVHHGTDEYFHGFFISLGYGKYSQSYGPKSGLYFKNNSLSIFNSIDISYRLNFPYDQFQHKRTLRKVFGPYSDITDIEIYQNSTSMFSIYTSRTSDEMILIPSDGNRRIKTKSAFMKHFPNLNDFLKYI